MSENTQPLETPATDCWASKQPQSPGATETKDGDQAVASNRAEGFASFGALLSAFIASSWCWLPPLLILGGISGAGMMTAVERFRPILMAVTFVFLGGAFYLSYRPRRSTPGGDKSHGATPVGARSTMMTLNRIMLWAVTAMVVVFLFFPQAFTGLLASNSEFTADMDRTVVAIEGMTWHTWAAKAEAAIKTAPGVLAVKVDYEAGQATIGTEKGRAVSTAEVRAALEAIGYAATFSDELGP